MEQKKKMSTTQKLSTSSYKTVSYKKEHKSIEFLKKNPQIICDKLKSHCFEYRKYIIITLIKYAIDLFLIIYLVSTY